MLPLKHVHRSLALLVVLSAAACGASSEDAEAYEDGLAATDDEQPEVSFAVRCDPRRPLSCNPRAATPDENRIWTKIASLPADVQSAYYGTSVSGIGVTPDGRAIYQFYQGTRGRGAVYGVNVAGRAEGDCPLGLGTFAIYGGVLALWEFTDYERGLGYPTGDRQGARQPFQCTGHDPAPYNQGLVMETAWIQEDASGQGYVQRDGLYMLGQNPRALSPVPQHCQYLPYAYCVYDQSAGNIQPLHDPGTPEDKVLWCGAGDPADLPCSRPDSI